MAAYRMPDGKVVEGDTPTDVIRAMNEAKMTPAKHLATYRRAMAERVQQAFGETIDSSTDDVLLAELVRIGLAEPV